MIPYTTPSFIVTISDGIFKCEVYALDWPDNISPFT